MVRIPTLGGNVFELVRDISLTTFKEIQDYLYSEGKVEAGAKICFSVKEIPIENEFVEKKMTILQIVEQIVRW